MRATVSASLSSFPLFSPNAFAQSLHIDLLFFTPVTLAPGSNVMCLSDYQYALVQWQLEDTRHLFQTLLQMLSEKSDSQVHTHDIHHREILRERQLSHILDYRLCRLRMCYQSFLFRLVIVLNNIFFVSCCSIRTNIML